jgi:tRNA pseudouridine38-40 synthase
MKNRYFLQIAFRGSHYHGWQKQNDVITVQDVLSEHISVVLAEEVQLHGCGRTDAGVHAKNYFLHFDTKQKLNRDFVHKMNGFLPEDIAVHAIFLNKERIHARYDALQRSYEYWISTKKNPFMNGLAVFMNEVADIELMNEASAILQEYEDFESFSKSNNSHSHYLCTLYEAQWRREKELLIFRITANRFVRSMVRMIVGTILMIGNKKITIREFRSIIEAKNRQLAGKSVPAHGLYLVDVIYPEGKLLMPE